MRKIFDQIWKSFLLEKIFNWIKNTSISEEGLYWFRDKDWIYIDWKKVIDGKNKIINWFSFWKKNKFYYSKYEEEKYENKILSFFYNYECEKN